MRVKTVFESCGRVERNLESHEVAAAVLRYLGNFVAETSSVSCCELEIHVDFNANHPKGPEFDVKVVFRGLGVLKTAIFRARVWERSVGFGDVNTGLLIGPQDMLKALNLHQMV